MPDEPQGHCDGDRTELGQWGPRGLHQAHTVRAPVQALFDSRVIVWVSRLTLVVLLALISWQSLTPATLQAGIPNLDKLLHALAYAGLAGLAVPAMGRRVGPAILFAALWGAGIELAQALMDLGRDGSAADAVANLLGAVVGAVVVGALTRKG